MKIGPVIIYKNPKFFAKVSWYLYKFFKIKRDCPCGRGKKENYLCCELSPTINNSYIEFDDYGFELKCKVCNSIHMSSTSHEGICNIKDVIDYYYGKGKFEGNEW